MESLATALFLLSSAFAQSFATARVQVISSLTKSPIPGARVTVGSAAKPDTGEAEGRTGINGIWEAKLTSTGSRFVRVTARGYRALGEGFVGKIANLTSDRVNDIVVEMIPLAVLTGRVLDEYGDPVRHAIVSTLTKPSDHGQGD